MSNRVRIWCLRHAEAENAATMPAGAVSADPCPPLTARGRHQAFAAAQMLAAEPISKIYSSRAPRARQTAEILAATLAASRGIPIIPVAAMPELAEADVRAEVLRAWLVEQELDQPATDGETGHQVVARVAAAFQQIARAHPGETIAVVGHVASLTVGLARLCSLGPGVWGTPLPHARPFLVECVGHAWRCPAWPGLRVGGPLPLAD
jgi:broad specificity phosphatase PhoE